MCAAVVYLLADSVVQRRIVRGVYKYDYRVKYAPATLGIKAIHTGKLHLLGMWMFVCVFEI